MKKKLAILLVGTMIASSILAGCGSKKSEPTKKETSGELKGDIKLLCKKRWRKSFNR